MAIKGPKQLIANMPAPIATTTNEMDACVKMNFMPLKSWSRTDFTPPGLQAGATARLMTMPESINAENRKLPAAVKVKQALVPKAATIALAAEGLSMRVI